MSDGTVTHIAGNSFTVQDRWMRQRCGWCGAVLLDYDLTRIQVMLEPCPTCVVPAQRALDHKPGVNVAPLPDCDTCHGTGTHAPSPSTWPAGRLVTVDGNASHLLEDQAELPEDACALLDPAVTA